MICLSFARKNEDLPFPFPFPFPFDSWKLYDSVIPIYLKPKLILVSASGRRHVISNKIVESLPKYLRDWFVEVYSFQNENLLSIEEYEQYHPNSMSGAKTIDLKNELRSLLHLETDERALYIYVDEYSVLDFYKGSTAFIERLVLKAQLR